ncbi:hypothetical protein AK812_SmicGene39019 [Symbiodinium microadriaticum]|uniref:Uncharacterized protein n=1 Tax=Symbiodinium microadriaticum TaxID=2951 RepID=A0A1Q9CC97_SYMMI|nr:hypothetical protein AK812_SmicGene39019 [Symbiodinium microadriaticum]
MSKGCVLLIALAISAKLPEEAKFAPKVETSAANLRKAFNRGENSERRWRHRLLIRKYWLLRRQWLAAYTWTNTKAAGYAVLHDTAFTSFSFPVIQIYQEGQGCFKIDVMLCNANGDEAIASWTLCGHVSHDYNLDTVLLGGGQLEEAVQEVSYAGGAYCVAQQCKSTWAMGFLEELQAFNSLGLFGPVRNLQGQGSLSEHGRTLVDATAARMVLRGLSGRDPDLGPASVLFQGEDTAVKLASALRQLKVPHLALTRFDGHLISELTRESLERVPRSGHLELAQLYQQEGDAADALCTSLLCAALLGAVGPLGDVSDAWRQEFTSETAFPIPFFVNHSLHWLALPKAWRCALPWTKALLFVPRAGGAAPSCELVRTGIEDPFSRIPKYHFDVSQFYDENFHIAKPEARSMDVQHLLQMEIVFGSNSGFTSESTTLGPFINVGSNLSGMAGRVSATFQLGARCWPVWRDR